MPSALQNIVSPLRDITGDIDRLQKTKRETIDRIDDITTNMNVEVARLTKTLFGTDRKISQAIRKMEMSSQRKNLDRIRNEVLKGRNQIEAQILAQRPDLRERKSAFRNAIDAEIQREILRRERQERSARPVVIQFQGQSFSVEQLDPEKIINQRKLTSEEEGALRRIVNRINQLGSFSNKVIRDTNAEIRLLDNYVRIIVDAVDQIAEEVRATVELPFQGQKFPIKKVIGAEEVQAFSAATNELEKTARDVKKIRDELRTVMAKAIKLRTTAKNVARLSDRVQSRADLEQYLTAISGGGALLAIAAAFTIGSFAGGIIALPTLAAFGLLKLIKAVKLFSRG